MPNNTVVSNEKWLEARKALLAKEKAFTKERDALTRERQALPWVRVEKSYTFDSERGPVTLAELFAGRSQLIVSHFMFHPDWEAGCKSCSFWADGYDNHVAHLNARDVSFVAISRASLDKLQAYRKRMGWHFDWVSSLSNDFNRDFGVTFTPEELSSNTAFYNYRQTSFPSEEAPGFSVFYRGEDGTIYHTYSCYSRGLDMMNAAYHLLDLVPKGRDELGLPFTMAWLRRRDEYGAEA